jgi:hypothetical protein
MKLKTRYERLKIENPYWSDTNCLAKALIEAKLDGQFYTKGTIARAFKGVDKSDYLSCDKGEVLESLYRLNFEI